jgi:hypothetical protein
MADISEQSPSKEKKDEKPRRFLNGWSKEQEILMANWGDLSACYRFLHDKSHKIYRIKSLLISSSVIVLSSVGGFANIGVQSLFKDDEKAKELASFAIGGLSLFAGMLTTLNNLLKYSQLEEAHRVSAIAWSKFGRLIMVELALHPNDRMDSLDFLKICRAELDRLIEQSPTIPQDIINKFEKKFGSIKDLKKPEVCGNLEHTRAYESSEERLKKVATEAALMLRRKKETLKELVTPEMEMQIAAQVNERLDHAITERKKRLEEELELQRKEDEDKRILEQQLLERRKAEIKDEIQLTKSKIESEIELEHNKAIELERIQKELTEERKKKIAEELELEKQKKQLESVTGINETHQTVSSLHLSPFESRLSMNRSATAARSRTPSIRRRSHIGDSIYTLETEHDSHRGIINISDKGSPIGMENKRSTSNRSVSNSINVRNKGDKEPPKNEIIIVSKE